MAKASSGQTGLDALLAKINHDHGLGTIMQLGTTPLPDVEVISTGSIALDEALGVGGFPRGRVVEIYGPESSGKTSAALRAAASAQKAGLVVGFIDAEHALDPEWARKLGVNTDALLLSQPDTGEQALEVTDDLAKSGLVGMVVIDSVAALVPKAEIEGAMGDSHVGLQARLMSQALRKLTGTLSTSKTTAIFINQLRERVGVVYGSPETTAGGKALKFYASVRLDTRLIERVKLGTDAVGIRQRVKVVKNKVSPPFKEAIVTYMFASGYSLAAELVALGEARGVLLRSGAWYSYAGQQIGQGKDAAADWLAGHPDEAALVEKAVREVGPPAPGTTTRKLTASNAAPWEADSG